MVLEKILEDNDRFMAIIKLLKERSDYYPKVHTERYGNEVFISTLVRIKRDDKYYKIHCVESCVLIENSSMLKLMLKFMTSVYSIQMLYKVDPERDEVDENQMDEVERLIELVS